MVMVRLSARGQVTIPKEIRERLKIRAGDKIDFQTDADGTVSIRPINKSPMEVFGMLASKTKIKATLEEIDEKIAEAFRKGEI